MHPSLAYMTLGGSKHVVAAILIGGGSPNALSIRPTDFVTLKHNEIGFRAASAIFELEKSRLTYPHTTGM